VIPDFLAHCRVIDFFNTPRGSSARGTARFVTYAAIGVWTIPVLAGTPFMLGSPAEQPLGRGRNLRLRGHEASNRTNRFKQSCVMNTSLSARGGTVADT